MVDRSLPRDEPYADVFAFSPAGETDVRIAVGLAATFVVAALVALPWVHLRTPELDDVLMPTVGAVALLAGFLGVGVCVSQFAISGQPAILYVSLALALQSIFTVLWWFTMPRVYQTAGISAADLQASPWLLVSRTFGFLLPLVMMAGCDIRETSRFCRDRRTVAAFCGSMLIAAAIAIAVCYRGTAALPRIVDGVHFTPFATRVLTPSAGLFAIGVLALLLFGKRPRHAIDVWLAVGMLAGLLEFFLSDAGGGRDTFGFYVGQVFGAASASAILLQMMAKMYGVLLSLMRSNRDLDALAATDELTGLANRRSFNRVAGALFAGSAFDQRRAALLMIDLDEFKRYNDGFGHAAGDRALTAVASAMRQVVVRASDVTARVGGEEFAVILRDTDLDGAIAVAERIRQHIAELAIPHAPDATYPTMTVSIGVAAAVCSAPGASFDELAARADAALYAAKSSGRNRVTAAPA